MDKIKTFLRGINLPSKHEIRIAVNSFSRKQRFLFIVLFAILAVSAITLLFKTNNMFMVNTPAYGGDIREGLITTPRFINPVLALSDSDKDLTALIYSGLMRKSANGDLIPDLALKYEISNDGLIYTFTLKPGLQFHDKYPVTADDIIFTVNKAKDPLIKSPKRLNWEGVTVEKIDDLTFKFILKQPFASFLENTTIGILPSHLWKEIKADQFNFIELNTRPIGTGPYMVTKIRKKSSGIPEEYTLEAFGKFALSKPYIKKLVIRFYENETALISALKTGDVNQAPAISPSGAVTLKDKGYRIETATLPRIFGLFFNQNEQKIFLDKKVVEAFELVIDKDRIINEVLKGYGEVINNPIPTNMFNYNGFESISSERVKDIQNDSEEITKEDENANEDIDTDTVTEDINITLAKQILEEDGWTLAEDGILEKTVKDKNGKKEIERLAFSIATGDQPELITSAELIRQDLAKIGASVEIKVFEVGSLNQDVIRPRKYEALFFGQIVGNESDLFAFWHSSQRNDPGLNIAMYTNSKVDKILEGMLDIIDKKDRIEKFTEFENEVRQDKPAIFIYSPNFIYVADKEIKGLNLGKISNSQDRFMNINEWYKDSDSIWKIFNKNTI